MYEFLTFLRSRAFQYWWIQFGEDILEVQVGLN